MLVPTTAGISANIVTEPYSSDIARELTEKELVDLLND